MIKDMTDLSDKIRNCRDGVVANPYQSKDKKVVFVCSMGILRSATAARIYSYKYNTRSAGTWEDHALVPLTRLLIDWADEIVFVNDNNWQATKKKYGPGEWQQKAKVLDIPDTYEHMHDALIDAFQEQYEKIPAHALYLFK